MNNLLSYCGLVDAKIRASEDLPVYACKIDSFYLGLILSMDLGLLNADIVHFIVVKMKGEKFLT